jgi:hypothetical protein
MLRKFQFGLFRIPTESFLEYEIEADDIQHAKTVLQLLLPEWMVINAFEVVGNDRIDIFFDVTD